MNRFTLAECRRLAGITQQPQISLHMPLITAGRDARQNQVMLRNQLDDAERQLLDGGMRTPDVRELLSSARGLIEDGDFWSTLTDGLAVLTGGLAVFIAPGVLRTYGAPVSLREFVAVGDRFHLLPLLPLLEASGRFFILEVSLRRVRLFEASRHTVQQIVPQNLPEELLQKSNLPRFRESLEEVLRSPSGQDSGGGEAIFFGQGAAADSQRQQGEIRNYFERLDRGLDDFFRDERAPLVFAGVERLFPFFRSTTHYRHVVPTPLTGNFEQADARQLHRQAWPLVEPLLRQEEDALRDRYGRHAGTGLASNHLEQILMAARQGAVDALFLARNAEPVWGRVDEVADEVVMHDVRHNGDEDLLNHSAVSTIQNGGSVYTFEPGELPRARTAAAVFRHPVAPALEPNP
jgi:hypothetical protein